MAEKEEGEKEVVVVEGGTEGERGRRWLAFTGHL